MTHRILVVDDDPPIRRLLDRFLSGNGFAVDTVNSAAEAEAVLAKNDYSLVILDIMMPDESGMDFLARLRATYELPVLLYSALEEADMRVTGLKLGADDYLIKSAPPEELLLRIRAILRRTTVTPAAVAPAVSPALPPAATATAPTKTIAGFTFEPQRGRLLRDGDTFPLPESQARLLALLYETPEVVHSRERLARALGQEMQSRTLQKRSIDAQISRLRRSLARIDKTLGKSLQTLRGRGYRLLLD
ncbi:MAG: response regulator transcription factor [Alphaproteobacteria bacterium]|nr:response regulator transcription factor [Alphaproteobacteria bacterium]MDA7987976.1 response regulator transcription factor [Alphaproteobacteria bacterium]